jgi:hypothetical protein
MPWKCHASQFFFFFSSFFPGPHVVESHVRWLTVLRTNHQREMDRAQRIDCLLRACMLVLDSSAMTRGAAKDVRVDDFSLVEEIFLCNILRFATWRGKRSSQ